MQARASTRQVVLDQVDGPKARSRFGVAGQLWFQVLVGTVAGIALGHLAPATGAAMKPLGDAFVALIRMMIGPVIFCTVVHGIAGMNDMKAVGRLAVKSIVYFEAITILALVFGLVMVDLWRPGVGMNVIDMKPEETPKLALRRMQRERWFR